MSVPRPDGGWGWAVTMATFTTNCLLDGVKFSSGVMFIDLLDTFNESKSKTSLVISIQLGASLLSGEILIHFLICFLFVIL